MTARLIAKPNRRRPGRTIRAAALGLALLAGGGAFVPAAAPAQNVLAQGTSMAPDEGELDVRLKGYEKKVGNGANSTTMMWMLFIGLTLAGLVPLFKNAKREYAPRVQPPSHAPSGGTR